jgi:hypothetical protein
MRYGILVLLNLPVILLALTNLVTRYKLKKIDTTKFRQQILLWLVLLLILVSSFPIYNVLSGRPLLDSEELSAFDIIQTTAIIALIYIVNNQRRKIEQSERYLRDFHQELSIKMSKK